MKGKAVAAIILIMGLSSCASVKAPMDNFPPEHEQYTLQYEGNPLEAVGVTAQYDAPDNSLTVGNIRLRLEGSIKLPIDERVYYYYLEDAYGSILKEKELDWLSGLGRASYSAYGTEEGVNYIYNIPISIDESNVLFPIRLIVTDPHREKKAIVISKK